MAAELVEDSNIIDAKGIFLKERQSGEVDQLYDVIHSREVYDRKDLFKIIHRINDIDVKNLPAKSHHKFHTLCGRVHTLNVNHMVDVIYEEATALSEGEYSSSEEFASRTQTLKEMMADVWTNNSLSKENCSFLRIASIKLSQAANETTSSKTDDMVHSPQVSINEDIEMLPESEVKGSIVDPEWENVELAFDLFEVAQFLHEGKIHEGEIKFRQLPENVQEKLGLVNGSPDYIQEVVATAYEMGRGDGYVPSQKEIELMFAEAPPTA